MYTWIISSATVLASLIFLFAYLVWPRDPRSPMKALSRCLAIVLGVPATLVLVVIVWLYFPVLRFRSQLACLNLSSSRPTSFSINTFDDEVSSARLSELYLAACNRARDLQPTATVRTYWSNDGDNGGWDGHCSVTQYSGAYIEIRAVSGNDSESVDVLLRPGNYDSGGKMIADVTLPPIKPSTRFIGWP